MCCCHVHTAPDGPPQNFDVMVEGVSLTFSWEEPVGDNLIQYYVLACTVDGEEALKFYLKPILEITIEELMPSTDYVCTITAATSGGAGPISDAITATTGGVKSKGRDISFLCVTNLFPFTDRRSQDLYLPFFAVGVTYGVEQQVLPESDEGISESIPIDPGFPFGDSVQTNFYVSHQTVLLYP